jgi:hypothetical protein
MGIFDIFTNKNAQDAANAQIAGINAGQTSATNAINTGSQDLTNYYTQALQPFLNNYNVGNAGQSALAAALGLNVGGSPSGAVPTSTGGGPQPGAAFNPNGPAPPGGGAGFAPPGSPNPSAAIAGPAAAAYASNPAYQFMLNQGNQNVLRNSAQTGTTASGATLNALQTQGQGLANQTYQQYVQNLMPFLGQSNTAASGIANVNTGLGSGLNQNQNNLANLNWNAATGIGNANANADLANNAADANIWKAIGGGVSALAGSGIGNPISTLSDERLKEDIKPIGKLHDDQPIYSYRYIWDDPAMTRIGLMAQDVEKINPDAVTEIVGFKAVDYGKATSYASELARFLEAA